MTLCVSLRNENHTGFRSAAIIRFSFSVYVSTAELGTRRQLGTYPTVPAQRSARAAPSHKSELQSKAPTPQTVPHPLPHEHHSHTSVVHAVFELHSTTTIPPIISGLRRDDQLRGAKGGPDDQNRLLLSSSSTRRPGLPWHPWLFLGWSRSPSLNAAASPHERSRLHQASTVHSCPRALCLLHP